MDDFNTVSLQESKNEWSVRLTTILTPLLIEGFNAMLKEAVALCRTNGDDSKYLVTFQNFLRNIPKWSQNTVTTEVSRIKKKSKCDHLEDLITCVHIIHVKILSAIRVSSKQKKIDLDIPKIDAFIHKAYINSARSIYSKAYLFEINIPPLEKQKHAHMLENIIEKCIIDTIRESIPTETILKLYMYETVEEDVTEDVKEELIDEKIIDEPLPLPIDENVVKQITKENTELNASLCAPTEETMSSLERLPSEDEPAQLKISDIDDNMELEYDTIADDTPTPSLVDPNEPIDDIELDLEFPELTQE